MIRLLLRLFNIRDFEVCKSCETLKQQLEYERSEKKQLTETLLNIINPKVIEQPPVVLNPVAQTSGLFSRRRAAMEEKDRQEARILAERKHIGVPDSVVSNPPNDPKLGYGSGGNSQITNLEQELGIEEKEA